jgi:hypothetical protein
VLCFSGGFAPEIQVLSRTLDHQGNIQSWRDLHNTISLAQLMEVVDDWVYAQTPESV